MNHELDKLVLNARTSKTAYMKAMKTQDLAVITKAAKAYHDAFDEVKSYTKWSLTRLFEVINEGKDY